MPKELTENEKRRLTALIAAPLKGNNPEVAEPVARMAVIEFTKVYRKCFGIKITFTQQDDIVKDVLRKLG